MFIFELQNKKLNIKLWHRRTNLTLKQRYEIFAFFAKNISQKETVAIAMLCKLELTKV
jgi:hypothetical protein